jgi:hypothetical protein
VQVLSVRLRMVLSSGIAIAAARCLRDVTARDDWQAVMLPRRWVVASLGHVDNRRAEALSPPRGVVARSGDGDDRRAEVLSVR